MLELSVINGHILVDSPSSMSPGSLKRIFNCAKLMDSRGLSGDDSWGTSRECHCEVTVLYIYRYINLFITFTSDAAVDNVI